jgi:uncharacterized protein (TIGR01777 family)
MYRVISGATGLIGRKLVEHWLQQGYRIKVIGRSSATIKKVFASTVEAITWDSLGAEDLREADLVVNLAGANIAGQRWTEAYKQEIINSRVHATEKLGALLATLGQVAPPLFNASAIGIYGLQEAAPAGLPPRFEEISAVDCELPPDFLAKVGCAWEAAALPAINAGVRVVFLRFGVVFAKEGGALPQMAQPFKFFVGGPVASGKQPVSWVAIDDLIRAIDFIHALPGVAGPFNIVAPGCVQQRELADAIAKVLHRPACLPMPGFALQCLFGKEFATDLLIEGQHVYPANLLDAGFQFEYPTVVQALKKYLL